MNEYNLMILQLLMQFLLDTGSSYISYIAGHLADAFSPKRLGVRWLAQGHCNMGHGAAGNGTANLAIHGG